MGCFGHDAFDRCARFLCDRLAGFCRGRFGRGFGAATGCLRRGRFPGRGLGGSLCWSLGGFLARFLGHTPSFRRFRRINQWGIAGLVPERRIRAGRWASLMAAEYGYKEFDAPPVRSLKARLIDSLGPATSNSINRGLAAMPPQER